MSSRPHPARAARTFSLSRFLWLALLLLLTAAFAVRSLAHASSVRDWTPLHAAFPHVSYTPDGLVKIDSLRDFTFQSPAQYTPRYYSSTFDPSEIVSAWFILAPLSDKIRGPAHSFVSFGFSDGRYLAISVEARRESGETFNLFSGIFNRFELLYVIGTEKDLIGQRAAFSSIPVYLYPVNASRDKMTAVFMEMVARADRVRKNPEFYNTWSNNCTSNVIVPVNHAASTPIPSGIKTILPGYMDDVAMSLGLINTSLSLTDARQFYQINARARRFISSPSFSMDIRTPER